jgi:hypothetical protein
MILTVKRCSNKQQQINRSQGDLQNDAASLNVSQQQPGRSLSRSGQMETSRKRRQQQHLRELT